MKKIVLLWSLLILPVWAQSLTLEQVRTEVLQNSHSIKSQDSKLRQRSHQIDEAFSAAYPQLTFQSGTFSLTPTVSFASPQGALPITKSFNYNVGVHLEQAIYTFGRLKWSTEAASLAREASAFELEAKRLEALETATQAYLDVVFTERAVTVAQQQRATRGTHLEEAKLKLRAGVIPPFEVLGFETALAQADQELLSARQQAELARTRLLLLMGRRPREDFELADTPPEEPPTEAPEIAVSRALERRPGLSALRKAIAAADAKVNYERSQNRPQLGFHTSYVRQTETAFQANQQWIAGLKLNVPLFDGGLVRARVSQAQEDVLQLQESLAQAETDITLEVEQLHSQLLTSWAQKQVAESALVQATEALRLAQLRYQVGVSTNLELLQAETAAAVAELAVHRTSYQALKSYYSWRRATGLEVAGGGEIRIP